MKKQITIQTENGFQVLDLEISFDNDNMDEASVMTIKTNYQGKEIIASGNHYPWEDAYANLQKQLRVCFDRLSLFASYDALHCQLT